MKQHLRPIAALLAAVLFLLSGCAGQTSAGAMGSDIWETMPQLTFGKLGCEKFEILDWNSGCCEATSCNMMAETENGYYLLYASWLWYADKTDLSKWVIVCSRPDCDHLGDKCYGSIPSSGFIVKDRRIYYAAASVDVPHLYHGENPARVILSMAANGTDKQLAYVSEETTLSGEGALSDLLLPDQWIVVSSYLDAAGIINTAAFRINEDGCEQFLSLEEGLENISIRSAKSDYSLYGDRYFTCNVLDETGTKIFCFRDDELIGQDIAGLPVRGGYLSGNTLRCFRPNDGYYDIDLTTMEEVRLADPRQQDSYSAVVLPNCIVESTLLYPVSTEGRSEGMSHSLEVFNGEDWISVTLPDELKYAGQSVYITVQAVTSNGLLLACRDSETAYKTTGTVYYHVDLSSEAPSAEYWTEIVLPKPLEAQ